ncbi:MAG: hypothetical protein WC683_07375 [bacterium]
MTRYLPLTYAPKIPKVLAGECTQTIRPGHGKLVGEFIAFHGWEGKPYRSKWSFRTPYWRLTEVIDIEVFWDGIACDDHGLQPWCELDDLARRDGIDPPTGAGLKAVFKQMYGRLGCCGFDMQILRWDPTTAGGSP